MFTSIRSSGLYEPTVVEYDCHCGKIICQSAKGTYSPIDAHGAPGVQKTQI